jgi:phage-related protein
MMQAVYYRDATGREPVRENIDALPIAEQDAIVWAIELLNRLQPMDPPLPFPHSSQVEGELRELRCHYGRTLYRVLYRRSEHLFVLLHILQKRTGAIPQADIDTARSRWANFKTRMDAARRIPPRAAGHDAP